VHRTQLWLSEHGIAVDIDLAIEAVQIAFARDHEGIDFQQSQIEISEELGKARGKAE
jgi:hypothetical protein